MRTVIVIVCLLCLAFSQAFSQVYLEAYSTPGTLGETYYLDNDQINIAWRVTDLKIVGHADVRDIGLMRTFPQLKNLNLLETTITAHPDMPIVYPMNELPYSVFNGKQLESILLPLNLRSIGSAALQANNLLKRIVFPSTLNTIKSYAFSNCSALDSVQFNDSLKLIEEYSFRLCTNLKTIKFSNSIDSIAEGAFYGCSGLTNVDFTTSVKTIPTNCFYDCTNLTEINLNDQITTIKENAFRNCTSLAKFTMPKSLSIIETRAFSNCSSITTLSLPSSLTYIGSYALSCSNLTSIYSYSTNPIDLSKSTNPFSGVSFTNCVLYVPKGSSDLYKKANKWSQFAVITEFDATPITENVSNVPSISYNKLNKSLIIKGIDNQSTIELFNLKGQLVKKIETGINKNISLKELNSGIYIAKLKTNKNQKSIKFIQK